MTQPAPRPLKIARAKPFEAGHNAGQAGHCLLYGEDTAGAHSLSAAVMKKGSEAPLHEHSREDETFYVVAGSPEARVGDDRHVLNEGDAVFLPRGVPHRLLCLSESAEVIMLIHPPGLERFFDEVDRLTADGPADPAEMREVAARYGVTIFPDR